MILNFVLEERVVLIVVFVHFVLKVQNYLVDILGLVDQYSSDCSVDYYY